MVIINLCFNISGTLQLVTHFMAGVLGGLIQDLCGRRKCLLISLIPQILSWLTLYFTRNVYYLYIQAVLIGLSTALSEQTITTYLGEISSPRLRGRLFSVSKLGYGFGSFIAYSVILFVPWRTLALLFLFLPIFSLFYVLWVRIYIYIFNNPSGSSLGTIATQNFCTTHSLGHQIWHLLEISERSWKCVTPALSIHI